MSTGMFGVTAKDVERLDKDQLPELLRVVMRCAALLDGTNVRFHVTSDINIADGGVDAVFVTDAPQNVVFPAAKCVFQCKTGDWRANEAQRELRKPEVSRALCDGFSYIYVHNRSAIPRQGASRQKVLRDAVEATDQRGRVFYYSVEHLLEWINRFAAAQHFVHACCQRSMICEPVDEAESLLAQKNPFVLPPWLEVRRDELRKEVQLGVRVIRVTGPAGVGKTRTAFRLTRELSASTFANALYVSSFTSELAGLLNIADRDKQQFVLVVDDCDAHQHTVLSRRMRSGPDGTGLLVTIGFDDSASPAEGEWKLTIRPGDQRATVRDMVEALAERTSFESGARRRDWSERVASYLGGYPRLASLLGDLPTRSEGRLRAGDLEREAFVERLTGLNEDSAEFRTLGLLALFSVLDDNSSMDDSERSDDSSACPQILGSTITGTLDLRRIAEGSGCVDGTLALQPAMREFARRMEKRHILTRAGGVIQVGPAPLADCLAVRWLAAQWGEGGRLETLLSWLESQPRLRTRFFQRMHSLPDDPDLDRPRKRIQELLTSSLQAEPERLLTPTGARLVEALGLFDPRGTLELIVAALATGEPDELGRQDVVRSLYNLLTKLAFDEELFDDAARCLRTLSLWDDKRWANNCEEHFIRLFRVILSDTQAPLGRRFPVLRETLLSESKRERRLGLTIAEEVVRDDRGFLSRSVGPEQWHSRHMGQPWHPRTKEDIDEVEAYRSDVFKLLATAAEESGPDSLAGKALGRAMLGVLHHDARQEFLVTIGSLVTRWGPKWRTAYQSLKDFQARWTVRWDGFPAFKARIDGWLQQLTPRDSEGQFELAVVRGEAGSWPLGLTDTEGSPEAMARERGKADAADLATVLTRLPVLCSRAQRFAGSYGFGLGQQLRAESRFAEVESLVRAALQVLRLVATDSSDESFIKQVLHGASSAELLDVLIREIAADEVLARYLVSFIIMRDRPLDPELVRLLRGAILAGHCPPEAIEYLWVAARVQPAPTRDFGDLLATLVERFGTARLAPVAIRTLKMWCYKNPNEQVALRDAFSRLTRTDGFLASLARHGLTDWKDFVQELVELDPPRAEALVREQFAVLAQSVTLAPSERGSGQSNLSLSIDPAVSAFTHFALQKFRATCWPVLVDHEAHATSAISLVRAERHSFDDSGAIGSVLDHVPLKSIEQACRKHPMLSLRFLRVGLSVRPAAEGGLVWSPWAVRLVELAEELLPAGAETRGVVEGAVYSAMFSMSWSGSQVPLLQARRALVRANVKTASKWWRDLMRNLERTLDEHESRERARDEERAIGFYREVHDRESPRPESRTHSTSAKRKRSAKVVPKASDKEKRVKRPASTKDGERRRSPSRKRP